ncbi:SpaH/EbpB family LPXTG-anchored major pilin [Corynebacterium sp. CCM 9204]|uniref:SpaH/EbpB family LPXTG-anchored major pilin n=1 Tax=Corynebacterium sp. CCM 9204 TaxID=3057616 RepID=UPI00352373F7
MSQNRKFTKVMIAGMSVAGMSLLSAGPGILLAAPASAADTQKPPKMPATATLKVNKFTEPEDGANRPANNGTEQTPDSSAKPIKDVTFTIKKVDGVDLTTNDGWRRANALVEEWKNTENKANATGITIASGDYAGTYNFVDVSPNGAVNTNADGVAEFPDLPAALYVVFESVTQEVVVAEGTDDEKTVPATSVNKAEPFIVSVPLTHPTELNKWLEVVNVYPKNGLSSITKTVVDAGTSTGVTSGSVAGSQGKSEVRYSVKTEIPKGRNINRYQIIDPIDHRLNYDSAFSDDALVLVDSSGAETSIDPSNYNIAVQSVDPAPTAGNTAAVGQYVTVTFNETGRALLNSNKGSSVKWTFDATLKKPEYAGLDDADNNTAITIPNQAYLVPNDGLPAWDTDRDTVPGTDTPPGTPSTEVESKYGTLVIDKKDKEDKSVLLPGAEFELYTCDASKTIIDQVSVNDKDKWTTDDNGRIVIKGIQLNDFKDGKSIANPTEHYCLKETKAPEKDGKTYELLPELLQFQLVQADPDFKESLEVLNVPSNSGFDLPLTGGNGIIPIIAVGGLLVAGAGAYAASSARRERKNNQ